MSLIKHFLSNFDPLDSPSAMSVRFLFITIDLLPLSSPLFLKTMIVDIDLGPCVMLSGGIGAKVKGTKSMGTSCN